MTLRSRLDERRRRPKICTDGFRILVCGDQNFHSPDVVCANHLALIRSFLIDSGFAKRRAGQVMQKNFAQASRPRRFDLLRLQTRASAVELTAQQQGLLARDAQKMPISSYVFENDAR